MDMSWQALLQEAAATSFEKTADTLAAAEKCFSIWKRPRGAFASTKNCYLQVWALRQAV